MTSTLPFPLMSHRTIQEVTPLAVLEAVARAQEQIDKELATLDQRMLELRSQRNAITCISSLPPELLAEVFMDYAYQAYKEKHNHYYRSRALMWISVTHVCRHWRQVALAFPALWTFLVLENPRWTEQMLIRSKMAPLVINVRVWESALTLMDTVGKALKHISRVRELSLIGTRRTMSKFAAPLMCPAPRLESLVLSDKEMPVYTHTVTAPADVPADLFGGQAPNLRQVTLEGLQIAWPSPLLVNLTHLDIRHLVPQFRPSLSQLMSTLSRMSALRKCILKDALPVLPENVMSVPTVLIERRVGLLALESLYLGATILECAQTLGHLNYPQNVILKLDCAATCADALDFSPLCPFISHLGGGNIDDSASSCAIFQSMLISLQVDASYGAYRAFVWCTALEERTRFMASSTMVMIEDVQDDIFQFALNASWSIPYVLSLSNIRNLVIDGHSDLSEGFLSKMLRNAHNLKDITFRDSSVSGFVNALAEDAPDGYQPGDDTIFLPSLNSITLEHVEFDYTEELYCESGGVTPMSLRDALMVRANQGVGIKRLVISECRRIFYYHARPLKEVVVDFDWDGVEHYDGETDDEDDEEDEDEDEDDYTYY
ncbi:hypothetical protein BJ138DRAFT_1155287 [Hygrophoropsis aurantiaca]|uniref:Uncharacterized protein n=1 Tax=Hygrophoropsis aurantiaca TaxID=72124 RepID=A0ACB8A8P5_9AGAM|nr:hypothetical protein BJ138DRAFT_1155287 [Hygrophoropsis aurantiaca]